MDTPSTKAFQSAINYPWLLAILAVCALIASKGYKPTEPLGTAHFVGPPSEPTLREPFLLRAKVGATDIGNAFAISVGEPSHPVILTAMHRFGPAGGLAKVPGAETVAAATSELSFSSGGGKPVAILGLQPLPIGLAATLGNSSDAGDIAGFFASGDGLAPAEVASYFPEVGSSIWLVIPGETAGQRTLRVTVFASEPDAGLFYYRFSADSLTLAQANANTGAPIIGLGGEVLGIHIGAASDFDDSPPYGLAQSAVKFLPHILQALNGPHPPSVSAMASTKQPEPK